MMDAEVGACLGRAPEERSALMHLHAHLQHVHTDHSPLIPLIGAAGDGRQGRGVSGQTAGGVAQHSCTYVHTHTTNNLHTDHTTLVTLHSDLGAADDGCQGKGVSEQGTGGGAQHAYGRRSRKRARLGGETAEGGDEDLPTVLGHVRYVQLLFGTPRTCLQIWM